MVSTLLFDSSGLSSNLNTSADYPIPYRDSPFTSDVQRLQELAYFLESDKGMLYMMAE